MMDQKSRDIAAQFLAARLRDDWANKTDEEVAEILRDTDWYRSRAVSTGTEKPLGVAKNSSDILTLLMEETDAAVAQCKTNGEHDICEYCELVSVLKGAWNEIVNLYGEVATLRKLESAYVKSEQECERLHQEILDANSALSAAENQGRWRSE